MIQSIITILLIIINILLIMIYIYERDKIEKEPIILIVLMIIMGVISVYLSREAWNIITEKIPEIKEEVVNKNWYARILICYGQIAFIEESIKYIILNLMIYRNKNYNYMYDGIIYSTSISLGFALMEGIEYGIGNGIILSLIRSILTIPMHASYGIIMGYYISKGKKEKESRSMYYRYMALIAPIVIHGTSDYMLSILTNKYQIIYIIYSVMIYIFALKKVNELARFDKEF